MLYHVFLLTFVLDSYLSISATEHMESASAAGETDIVGGNYSHDGYLLPCVPEADTK